ncbi:coproporphyrinogen III oxidase [hot springs metagenome]|uniref:Coproporphyrinogen III oxidase n=1 Tax=hot springs metagenome TaxID=433727 RepID=A0A5J4L661_9ZZZZ
MINYLYIHIPFCIKKCVYCDFYSIPFKSKIAEDYIKALCKEIEFRKGLVGNLTTIYIGGGTPTILTENEIARLFEAIKDNYAINPDNEITIEANPRTITSQKAEKLLDLGINRISIGVQSFVDNELITMGRSHNADDAVRAVKDIRNAGFKNISIDLIYATPYVKGQGSKFKGVTSSFEFQIQNWVYSLQKALELNPEHISIYELTPEVDTPLYEGIKNRRLIMPDEVVISEMYYKGIDMLKAHGYNHYEISNFARPGYECRHNLNYWNRGYNKGEYLGIGVGAHSFIAGKRISNTRDINYYIESINNNKIPIAEEHYITNDEALKEFIFLGMRKIDGIDIEFLPDKKRVLIKKAVEDLAPYGLVEIKDNHLRLTRKGLILMSEVIVQVLLSLEESRPS